MDIDRQNVRWLFARIALATLVPSFLGGASVAYAAPEYSEVTLILPLPNAPDRAVITGLTVDSVHLDVMRKSGQKTGYVRISCKYARRDWEIVFQQRAVPVVGGSFQIEVPLAGPLSPLFLRAVGPLGQAEEEVIKISYPGFGRPPVKRNQVVASLGVSLIHYEQTEVAPLSEQAITLKIAYNYQISPHRWDLGLSGYYTVLPIHTDRPGVNIRYIGANARVGYTLTNPGSNWSARLMTGLYYTTTFVKGDTFGFQNQVGLQLFPVVSLRLNPRISLSGYFKFSPILNGYQLLNVASRELAQGLTWSYVAGPGQIISLSADFAQLQLNFQGLTIQSSSSSISAGYALLF